MGDRKRTGERNSTRGQSRLTRTKGGAEWSGGYEGGARNRLGATRAADVGQRQRLQGLAVVGQRRRSRGLADVGQRRRLVLADVVGGGGGEAWRTSVRGGQEAWQTSAREGGGGPGDFAWLR